MGFLPYSMIDTAPTALREMEYCARKKREADQLRSRMRSIRLRSGSIQLVSAKKAAPHFAALPFCVQLKPELLEINAEPDAE